MSSLSPAVEQTIRTETVPFPIDSPVDWEHTGMPVAERPRLDHIVTEDDEPVDNIFSERQQRLLTESLYASWKGPSEGPSDERRHPFLALANVGLFYSVHKPPLVPDVLLSLDVQPPKDMWPKHNRSYFTWEYGKPPDVVVEIVSNREGGETGRKLRTYAEIGVAYYVIYDPGGQLGDEVLRLYELRGGRYSEKAELWLPKVKLGLTLWQGVYEDAEATWLRWCDRDGDLMLTGVERSVQERRRAEQALQQAEQQRQRAEQALQQAEQQRQRAERLAERLRALGVEPNETNFQNCQDLSSGKELDGDSGSHS